MFIFYQNLIHFDYDFGFWIIVSLALKFKQWGDFFWGYVDFFFGGGGG